MVIQSKLHADGTSEQPCPEEFSSKVGNDFRQMLSLNLAVQHENRQVLESSGVEYFIEALDTHIASSTQDLLQSDTPPCLSDFLDLPSATALSDELLKSHLLVYIACLTKEGAENRAYVGSGSNPDRASFLRVSYYKNYMKDQTSHASRFGKYAKASLAEGYKMAHVGVLATIHTKDMTRMFGIARLWTLTLEDLFSFWLWTIREPNTITPLTYGMLPLCQWSIKDLDYKGINSGLPALYARVHQLSLTDEQMVHWYRTSRTPYMRAKRAKYAKAFRADPANRARLQIYRLKYSASESGKLARKAHSIKRSAKDWIRRMTAGKDVVWTPELNELLDAKKDDAQLTAAEYRKQLANGTRQPEEPQDLQDAEFRGFRSRARCRVQSALKKKGKGPWSPEQEASLVANQADSKMSMEQYRAELAAGTRQPYVKNRTVGVHGADKEAHAFRTRARCCVQSALKKKGKGPWSPEQEASLVANQADSKMSIKQYRAELAAGTRQPYVKNRTWGNVKKMKKGKANKQQVEDDSEEDIGELDEEDIDELDEGDGHDDEEGDEYEEAFAEFMESQEDDEFEEDFAAFIEREKGNEFEEDFAAFMEREEGNEIDEGVDEFSQGEVSNESDEETEDVDGPVPDGIEGIEFSESDSDLGKGPRLPRTRYRYQGFAEQEPINLTISDDEGVGSKVIDRIDGREDMQQKQIEVAEHGGVGDLDDEWDSNSDSDLDAGPRLPRTKYQGIGHGKRDAIELPDSDEAEVPMVINDLDGGQAGTDDDSEDSEGGAIWDGSRKRRCVR